MIGKPWSCWNLPEQPTELDLRKLREAFQQPDHHRGQLQSTPLPAGYLPLFGQHPDIDFLSITKCPACGWLLKMQHANKHFLRDSRGAIVCKDSDLAIYGSKVLGKALHPVGEIKDSYSKKITLRIVQPAHGSIKATQALRGALGINDIGLSKSRSGSSSHSSKTDYMTHSSLQYRSRSHSQAHPPPPPSYTSKSRTGGSSSSSSHLSHSSNHTSVKGKSSKSTTQTSNSSWSSLRSSSSSSSTSKSSSSHKPSHTNSGSYTLSIPSEDMGGSESVEDLLMSSVAHNYGSSKHTVHIIATSNSASKAKAAAAAAAAAADPYYDHVKNYSDVPEKRIKLDSSHSRSSDHHHQRSSDHHHSHHSHHKSSSSDGHSDSYSKSKSKHSSSGLVNGTVSSHGASTDSKKSKSSSSSTSSHSKNETSSSNKHHLRSSAPTTLVSATKPHVSLSSLSSGHSSRSHTLANTLAGSNTSDKEKDRDREKTSSPKKKKRKREKDEPRKIIPLKDRDFNPDKHCGVCTTSNNLPCKRSLTCKTHSVALRRAVGGRSQSFDALLAAHKLAKTEEKNYTTPTPTTTVAKKVVEEVIPPKPKKKKPSGTNSNSGTSPNDLPTLGVVSEPRYARSVSPDIEVIAVRTKPIPPAPEVELVRYPPKKYKTCPLVYPYEPENQAKFEEVWYDPQMLEGKTAEEKRKFRFLLCHYKNPHFLRCEVPKPLVKNVREKRNVFSNWNPHEKPLAGYQHNVSWTPGERQRQISLSESEEDLQLLGHYKKK
ncbi:unnamed protein product [Orchesella dallaii]|uniref:SCA7 domain-containing protein n=1 Tax=Orchesella dallaii TaxID=48710 RepID=A0ABP1QYR8_9HEXA